MLIRHLKYRNSRTHFTPIIREDVTLFSEEDATILRDYFLTLLWDMGDQKDCQRRITCKALVLGHDLPCVLLSTTRYGSHGSSLRGRGNWGVESRIAQWLHHGCARVAHCVTARWCNFSHYCRSLRQYDVWFTSSDNKEALEAAPTAHGVHKQAFRVRHWTSREVSLRHSSGWGTEAFSLSSVICAPVNYTVSRESTLRHLCYRQCMKNTYEIRTEVSGAKKAFKLHCNMLE